MTGAEKLAKCAARVAEFKDKPCDLIFIGDSITELWLDQKRGGLPIWTQKYEPLHTLNFGIGGDTVQNVLWRFENMDIKRLRPKVAVIMIGTNNRNYTIQQIAEGVKAVITKTQTTFPGVKIILVSILPSNRESGGSEALAINDRMLAADGIIKNFADDKSVFWIDLVPMMPAVTTTTADGKQVLNFKGLSIDRIHPDGVGYQMWADAMDPVLKKLLSGNLAMIAPAVQCAETAEQYNARVAAWRAARFGMFVHWGPVSLTEKEIGWTRGRKSPWGTTPQEEYDQLYKKFNPVQFNADEWVAIAKAAGAKYIVPVCKHHDGFCMWDTKQTPYNIMNSPFGRDVIKELSEACRRQGVAFGVYYSIADFYHPDYGWPDKTVPGYALPAGTKPDQDRYEQYVIAQMSELCTKYGPIVTCWFDWAPRPWSVSRGLRVYNRCLELQPGTLVNDRLGLPDVDEKGHVIPSPDRPADFGTFEQRPGGFDREKAWEANATLTKAAPGIVVPQWSWQPGAPMHSREDCIRMLVCAAVDDGNLLLNVSPMPDGRIEKRQADRMGEIGAWLGRYGQSIYGTRGGPFVAPDEKIRKSTSDGTFYLPVGDWWGGSTCHGNSIFLHILRWPHDVLSLPPLPRKVVGHNVLTGGTAEVRQTPEHLEIEVPTASRDALDTIVELKVDGPAEDIAPIQQPTHSLMAQGRITASSFFANQKQWGPELVVDGDAKSRWVADKSDKLPWLQVDFDAPHEVSSVYVKEALGGVEKFALRYRSEKDDPWLTCLEGTTIGQTLLENFPPVKACAIRLEFLQCSKPPVSISEFHVFSPVK